MNKFITAFTSQERMITTLSSLLNSINESRLFNQIKKSHMCKCIKFLLMSITFLISSPFIMILLMCRRIVILPTDSHETRNWVYTNRFIFGLFLLFVLLGMLEYSHHAGEN